MSAFPPLLVGRRCGRGHDARPLWPCHANRLGGARCERHLVRLRDLRLPSHSTRRRGVDVGRLRKQFRSIRVPAGPAPPARGPPRGLPGAAAADARRTVRRCAVRGTDAPYALPARAAVEWPPRRARAAAPTAFPQPPPLLPMRRAEPRARRPHPAPRPAGDCPRGVVGGARPGRGRGPLVRVPWSPRPVDVRAGRPGAPLRVRGPVAAGRGQAAPAPCGGTANGSTATVTLSWPPPSRAWPTRTRAACRGRRAASGGTARAMSSADSA